MKAASPKKPSFLRSLLEIVFMVVLALALTWGLRSFVVQPFEIPTGSMDPTIAIGDMVLSERISYYTGDVEPGDIITFADLTGDNDTLIKRCIATGGQTVDIRDGSVYVDGVKLDEPYVYGKPSERFVNTFKGITISYPYTVPKGYLWVMGDNRTNSGDSRYFGPIAESTVSGRAFFTYWPISQIGPLG